MCVAPVKIGHVGTKEEVSSPAMLDNYSQGTFIKESINKKLGVSARKSEITIKTLDGKQNMEPNLDVLKVSKNVHDERVRNSKKHIPRENLPADVKKEVAIQEKQLNGII